MKNIVELLKNTFLFNGVEEHEIKSILKRYQYSIAHHNPNDIIRFRGDHINEIYVILEGFLVTEMLNNSGEIAKLERLETGEVLATAFIFGNHRQMPMDVLAKEEVTLFILDKENLVELLTENRIIMDNFIADISNRTQYFTKQIWDNFNNKTIAEKLNYYIKLQKNNTNVITLSNSVKELAEKFQVTRPSLSRIISKYIKNNILEKIGRNKYKILSQNYFQ